ncbi:hypothetical protein AB7942_21710 [Neobacillus sp. BF23-41]|uniref:hypothetical protein n=1 Tax=Neobacillus sp. BF23-41 TaxID=3240280 RepID=UPI0034E41610
MSGDFNIIGFHGTFEKHAQDILENGFHPEYRANHWLGQGSYFYTDRKLAHWFITKNAVTDHRKRGIGSNKVIIKVFIEEKEELVLNLDSPDGVNTFYYHLNEIYPDFKHVKLSSDEHVNLCIVLDVLSEYLGWNVIIKTFETDRKPSYGSVNTGWFDRNVFPLNVKYKETQICIRNDNCVKNKEIEYPDGDYAYPVNIRFS